MPKLIFLGTASAIPDSEHKNTHLALQAGARTVLIDCASNPVTLLPRAGIKLMDVTDLILTHFHPDHVSATPTLLMSSWLLGRRALLNIYGLAHTLDRVEKMMELYDWSSWPGFFPVIFHRSPEEELAPVFSTDSLHIFSSPVRHLIPSLGLRIEFPRIHKAIAYSSDTEPCQAVVKLANNVDALIHEATSETPGHSSARQAGEIATQANAKALYLIHYRAGKMGPHNLVGEAQQVYNGPVHLAQDLESLEF